jgi:hypothetical protein
MKYIALIVSLISLFTMLNAETVSLSPSDDMYTDPEHAGTTPTITQLWTANYPASGHYERVMMRFDLSPYVGRQLESAVLHLTRLYSCPSSGTTTATFYAIDQAWDEDTWDYTSHITYHEDVSMNYVFTGTGGNAIVNFTVDITDLVMYWTESVIENHGFAIVANNNQKFSKFYSKEFSNEAYRPTLTLTYSQVGNSDEVVSLPTLSLDNYPNPFNPNTTIRFNLPTASDVRLTIYDLRGGKVFTTNEHRLPAGEHNVAWNGRNDSGNPVASGVYLCRVETAAGSFSKPITLLK